MEGSDDTTGRQTGRQARPSPRYDKEGRREERKRRDERRRGNQISCNPGKGTLFQVRMERVRMRMRVGGWRENENENEGVR